MTNRKIKLDHLIVGAHSSELLPFVSLGRKHHLVKDNTGFLAAGVGPVAATFGLMHFLEDHKPEQLIAVGTAGIINGKKFKVGDVVVAKSAATVSGFEECYAPNPNSSLRLPPLKVRGGLARGYQFAKVFSPQEITRSPIWQKQLLKSGFDVEHLESFAFAFVAKKFRIPITIVLGLTNVIDKNAHRDWLKNQTRMVKKVCRAVSDMRGTFL